MAKKKKEETTKIKEETTKIKEETTKTKEEKTNTKEDKTKIKEEKTKIKEEKHIVVLVEWEGFTKEIYEKIRKPVNWEGDVPKGMTLHLAAFDEKGMRVTDVWESEEDFNNFIQNRIIPVTEKLVETKPSIEIYPLHAFFIP